MRELLEQNLALSSDTESEHDDATPTHKKPFYMGGGATFNFDEELFEEPRKRDFGK